MDPNCVSGDCALTRKCTGHERPLPAPCCTGVCSFVGPSPTVEPRCPSSQAPKHGVLPPSEHNGSRSGTCPISPVMIFHNYVKPLSHAVGRCQGAQNSGNITWRQMSCLLGQDISFSKSSGCLQPPSNSRLMRATRQETARTEMKSGGIQTLLCSQGTLDKAMTQVQPSAAHPAGVTTLVSLPQQAYLRRGPGQVTAPGRQALPPCCPTCPSPRMLCWQLSALAEVGVTHSRSH